MALSKCYLTEKHKKRSPESHRTAKGGYQPGDVGSHSRCNHLRAKKKHTARMILLKIWGVWFIFQAKKLNQYKNIKF
ncbi:hypothetical protein D7V68_13820 [Acinetobacter cumulans]|jgi:hypothetical protein|nr:hypothetical protein D7V68_13820 [Acinetobacter cumulans]